MSDTSHTARKADESDMDGLLTSKSCIQFSGLLASKQPVPGGGGAAALVGALGAALCSMAGNLTLGRKKYAAWEDDIRRILASGLSIRTRLLELVDIDAANFEPLSAAYSLPKDLPNRQEILQKAAVEACRAPIEMMEQCCAAIELLEEMLNKGSSMLVSDVGCGAILCQAALRSAGLNVLVNTKTIADRQEASKLNRRVNEMWQGYLPRADAVARTVEMRLSTQGE